MTAPMGKPAEADRSFWLMAALSVAFTITGWFFQSDFACTDAPFVTAYAVALGDTCEADFKTCHVKPLPPVGYRADTNRDEVVAFDPANGLQLQSYEHCTIWDSDNWTCQSPFMQMRVGVVESDLTANPDYYPVPKVAWKMAKLGMLSVDSVRHTPRSKPERKA